MTMINRQTVWLLLLAMIVVGCSNTSPETVEVEVTKEVDVTVEVTRVVEVEVETEPETVEVEVTKEVEVTVEVTRIVEVETEDKADSETEIKSSISEMKSAGVLTFAPDDVLLVADSKSGTIFAFEVEAGSPAEQPQAYNLYDINLQIAAALGTTVDQITINDLAVHPVDRMAYLSVQRGHGDAAVPVILTVDHTGEIGVVDLADVPYTSVAIDQLPDDDVVFWDKISARSLSITDIDYYDGELYVAGLSNADFSSELRRIPYPFDGTVAHASTEIYHTIHDQNETRAPIRTQTIIQSGDEPILLAAYTCTPLVTLPLGALEDGAHVSGKTIAELGYGNTPIDLIQFQTQGQDGTVQDMVLVTNTDYSAMVFSVDQILAGHDADGLTEVVSMGMTEGVQPFRVPMSGVLQVSDLDPMHLLMLRTNKDSDHLDLVSTVKGAYLRLSDFVSEYDSVGYDYPADGSQDFIKGFQNMLRVDEAYPDEVVE